MPLKILHPKHKSQVTKKFLIVQGKCDNSAKVSGYVVKKGAAGPKYNGQLLTSANNKHWGLLFKNLPNDSYTLVVNQVNSPIVTDTIDFDVLVPTSPLPPPQMPPQVTYPAPGDNVPAAGFFPYGTSTSNISSIVFANPLGTLSVNGTVTQQPDSEGFWTASVTGIDTWPTGLGNFYKLDVSNSSGTTTVNSIVIAP
jgi:hypothetical protein